MRKIEKEASLGNKNKGFSLVELSIVLVILGLLTGGILTGQSLIRAAELRAVTTEIEQYKTATSTFRDKYFALPGDMRNATDFWGEAHPTYATCQTTVSTGTETCNGDGDGRVVGETSRFWQHLANAGLITGSFDGVSTLQGAFASSRLSGNLINAIYYGTKTGDAFGPFNPYFDGNYGHVFAYSKTTSQGTTSPEELWNIDTKIDDGMPATGNVRAFHLVTIRTLSTSGSFFLTGNCTVRANGSANTHAAASIADSGSTYDLQNSDKVCSPIFANAF